MKKLVALSLFWSACLNVGLLLAVRNLSDRIDEKPSGGEMQQIQFFANHLSKEINELRDDTIPQIQSLQNVVSDHQRRIK